MLRPQIKEKLGVVILFFNIQPFIVNKAKIQNSITKLTKDNIKKFITTSKQDFKVDIDSIREAIDSSVELHKLILHQLLLNQQIKFIFIKKLLVFHLLIIQ